MTTWIRVCALDAIAPDDLVRFDHGGRTFVIVRSPQDEVFCLDGLCTHEKVHLERGLVMDGVVECPKHRAQFDYRTGEAIRAPACIDLSTWPARVEDGVVFVAV